ncbi:hypothetical protein [Siphonobacter sp. BAB-5385]|uniref:hypothetical protein n=1 Tax=Siphonobacter sp. BAB-5385 TaxID=1864822 RepID=UPI000B9E0FCB|nr:hypothetical protein [Siphonobacter sp. BAB-5385]
MNHLPVSQPIRWHYLRRTALWFVALYTILYTLPLTDMEAIIELTEWVGPQVLHLDNAKKYGIRAVAIPLFPMRTCLYSVRFA